VFTDVRPLGYSGQTVHRRPRHHGRVAVTVAVKTSALSGASRHVELKRASPGSPLLERQEALRGLSLFHTVSGARGSRSPPTFDCFPYEVDQVTPAATTRRGEHPPGYVAGMSGGVILLAVSHGPAVSHNCVCLRAGPFQADAMSVRFRLTNALIRGPSVCRLPRQAGAINGFEDR
jgi:hypothetical protein